MVACLVVGRATDTRPLFRSSTNDTSVTRLAGMPSGHLLESEQLANRRYEHGLNAEVPELLVQSQTCLRTISAVWCAWITLQILSIPLCRTVTGQSIEVTSNVTQPPPSASRSSVYPSKP